MSPMDGLHKAWIRKAIPRGSHLAQQVTLRELHVIPRILSGVCSLTNPHPDSGLARNATVDKDSAVIAGDQYVVGFDIVMNKGLILPSASVRS